VLCVCGVTDHVFAQDQYDVIDFSDNDIKKLDNFPLMSRLNALMLSNNAVTRVTAQLGEQLPRLEVLILSNNKISHLYEIDNIAGLKKIQTLSLMDNPVAFQSHYRAYVIHKIPQLKTLDFAKITKKEKEETKLLFSSPAGKTFLSNIQQGRALYMSSLEQKKSASQGGNQGSATAKTTLSLTEEQRKQVKEAIEQASTKEDIDLIEYQLRVRLFFAVSQNSLLLFAHWCSF
jgi:U2 small nuclear ribonucleoprotein A'